MFAYVCVRTEKARTHSRRLFYRSRLELAAEFELVVPHDKKHTWVQTICMLFLYVSFCPFLLVYGPLFYFTQLSSGTEAAFDRAHPQQFLKAKNVGTNENEGGWEGRVVEGERRTRRLLIEGERRTRRLLEQKQHEIQARMEKMEERLKARIDTGLGAHEQERSVEARKEITEERKVRSMEERMTSMENKLDDIFRILDDGPGGFEGRKAFDGSSRPTDFE